MNKDGEEEIEDVRVKFGNAKLNFILYPAVQNERQPRNTATIRPETLKVFT